MGIDTKQLLAQIDAVDIIYNSVHMSLFHNDPAHLERANQFVTMAHACIERITGQNSVYARRADRAIQSQSDAAAVVYLVHGVLQGLRNDLAADRLTTLQELIHADLFSDYLGMAEHLLSEGYLGSKDAAAVLAGGTLEEHMRQLCSKNNIPVEKSVETMNTKLRAANVYGLNEQKQVTAWYGLRTSAAHANYGDYTKEQVELFIQGLRQFIRLYPA